MDDDFSEVTILVPDEDESWNSGDGYMMSAPAISREEALEISNRLMKDYLVGVNPLK